MQVVKLILLHKKKAVILSDNSKFRNIFPNIWGHSNGWLMFSCPYGVADYLTFLLRSESSHDYIDGLLSMKHIPNVAVIDMVHIIAKDVLTPRKDDTKN